MNRIGLKINGIWCVLPQDVSISIEEQNPLFSDSGSFSYPIEMSVSQNRELFKSIDSPHGRIRPQDLDGLPFELWYDGVMLLYGSTETDEDLDIEEDKCSINLVSGNGDFQSKIDGMQCTDVPLLDEIYLGDYYPGFKGKGADNADDPFFKFEEFDEPLDSANNMDFKACNVSDPYPVKPYCNIRVCVQRNADWGNWWERPYYILEADRPWSGMCFYVAYFLECLVKKLGYIMDIGEMLKVEDMKRLAFVSTKCAHRLGEKESLGKATYIKAGKYVDAWLEKNDVELRLDDVYRYKVYATEKNFPETDISNFVESMFSAFGLKLVVNEKENKISMVYMRDIFRDNDILDTDVIVKDKHVSYTKTSGVKLTYGGDEEDTSFNYKDFDGEIELFPRYHEMVAKTFSSKDKKLYINAATGNKYRVKVDSDAEKEEDLNPALFEVAQFSDYIVGEESDEMEELKIGFTPLIENDADYRKQKAFRDENTQCLALYIDGNPVDAPVEIKKELIGGRDKILGVTVGDWFLKFHQNKSINFKEEHEENPITSYDCGFMLGVMRGPGSHSGYAVQIENYDGNGNSAWVTVEDGYAFTSDSIDAYGNHYDYNGDIEGGVVGLEDTISLKTHIQTAKDVGLKNEDGTDVDWGIDATAAKRGLADRFMSEYMYFLLHRKTVSMDVDTTLSHLTSLSWFKQLRISDTVGRLKSRSYTLTNSGVTDMSIELYTIN